MADERHDKDNAGAPSGGDKPTGTTDPDQLTEEQIASDLMGNHQMEGDDPKNRNNERKAQPGVKHEANDSPLESFREMDDTEDKEKPGQ